MIIRIKVKANSKENKFEGLMGNFFVIRIKDKPENGKANKALIKFLANKLGINSSKIKILTGVTSQGKTLELDAPLDIQELIKQLKS